MSVPSGSILTRVGAGGVKSTFLAALGPLTSVTLSRFRAFEGVRELLVYQSDRLRHRSTPALSEPSSIFVANLAIALHWAPILVYTGELRYISL